MNTNYCNLLLNIAGEPRTKTFFARDVLYGVEIMENDQRRRGFVQIRLLVGLTPEQAYNFQGHSFVRLGL